MSETLTLASLFKKIQQIRRKIPMLTVGEGEHKRNIPMSRVVIMVSNATVKGCKLAESNVLSIPIGVSLVLIDTVPYGQIYIVDRKDIVSYDPLAVREPHAAETIYLLYPEGHEQ